MAKIKMISSRPVDGKMKAAGTVLQVGKDISGQTARDFVSNGWAELQDGARGIQNADPGAPGSGVKLETRGGKAGKNAD